MGYHVINMTEGAILAAGNLLVNELNLKTRYNIICYLPGESVSYKSIDAIGFVNYPI